MIEKSDFVPLAPCRKPLSEARLTLISSCGVHSKSDPALDVRHPFGDFRFRRIPSSARHEDLIIHQVKYPHEDGDLDINVIFPIERLQELAGAGVLGRPYQEFLQLHRLQHGSGEVRAHGRARDRRRGCDRRESRCRLAGSRLTDLPSVRRTDPTCDRSAGCTHGLSYRRSGCDGKDQGASCYFSAMANGPPLWRPVSQRTAKACAFGSARSVGDGADIRYHSRYPHQMGRRASRG